MPEGLEKDLSPQCWSTSSPSFNDSTSMRIRRRGKPHNPGSMTAKDGLLSIGADGDNLDRRTDELGDRFNVLLCRTREIVVAPDAGDIAHPAGKRAIDRNCAREVFDVTRKFGRPPPRD